MSGDYKFDIQSRAEEIADQEFGKDFYDLTDEQLGEVYRRAVSRWSDDLLNRADQVRKAMRESE